MQKEQERFRESNIMEGMISFRAVIAGIESGNSTRRIERVLFDRSRAKSLGRHLSYIKAKSYQHGFEMVGADSAEIDALAVGSSHGGLLTVCTQRELPSLEGAAIEKNSFYIMLCGLEDPYNFGYALRSIYASGAAGVLLTPHNWMSAAGVVCRASAGASEQMPLYQCEPEEAVTCFRTHGYRIVAADQPDSTPMWETDLSAPLLLLIGGERRGIPKTVLAQCDAIVSIDYGRDFPAALSAASASSILAFEIARQNRHIRGSASNSGQETF